MTKQFRLLNHPLGKKADGGDMFSDDQINGTQYPVAPTSSGPANVQLPTNMSAATLNLPSGIPAPQTSSLSSSIGKIGTSIAPYASNIVNSFRTPPQPSMPHLDNMVTVRSPSFAAERVATERNMNADAESAARNVDGSTGARIRLFNSGQKLDRLSNINERDNNSRLSASNEQARINAGISVRNNEKLDTYGNQQVERQIAQQRTQSENLSNLSDKIVSIQNEREKRNVDLEKTRTMASLFSKSGVGNRERDILRGMGVPDPLGKEYSDLDKKSTGGTMGIRVDHSRGFYRNVPVRSQTLKSTYKAPN